MSLESLTFWLALLGYLGLAYNACLSITDHDNRAVTRVLAPIIFTHVLLVWSLRYEWQLAQATRKCDFCSESDVKVKTDFDTEIPDRGQMRFALVCETCDQTGV